MRRPRPSRRFSASTRAGGLGDPCAEARVAAGAAQQPRLHLVPTAGARHQDQVVAGLDRAFGCHGHVGAVQHGLGLDAVGDHGALEVELARAAGRAGSAGDWEAIRRRSSAG